VSRTVLPIENDSDSLLVSMNSGTLEARWYWRRAAKVISPFIIMPRP